MGNVATAYPSIRKRRGGSVELVRTGSPLALRAVSTLGSAVTGVAGAAVSVAVTVALLMAW
jgi:hypothetical protein